MKKKIKMLLYSIISLIMSNSLVIRRDISIYYSRIGMFILFYCILNSYSDLYLRYIEKGLGLYGGLFNISSLSLSFGIIIFILTLIILNLTGFYPRTFLYSYKEKTNLNFQKLEQYRIIEYTLIILFIITGSIFLMSSNDFISLYISLELQSYGLYILSTIYRNSEPSTGSGLTYFLLGGLSSCFILLGIGLIYTNSGTTYLDNFYIITNITNLINELNYIICWDIQNYIGYSLLLIIIGFLFKISAAPFHIWSPDVYDGLPTIVTTFVAILPKISIFVVLFQLLHYINNEYNTYGITLTNNILLSSLLSLIIGTVLGLNQIRIKRLLAYSTISHLGFILLGLCINSVESIQSFIFYIIQYSFSNLNTFFILIAIGYNLYFYINKNNKFFNLLDKNNSPVQLISQMKGYFYINPILAISLAISLFSFAGIPPLVGFFGKLFVLSAAIQNGYVFLAFIVVITSVIGAVYYLNVIKLMFFEENPYKYSIDTYNKVSNEFSYKIYLSNALSIIISIFTLIICLFMFMSNQILHWSNLLSIIFFTYEV